MAGFIYSELCIAIGQAPEQEAKSPYIFDQLDQIFKDFDWTMSFDRPVIIVYDEVIYSLCFIEIHNWLRKKSCNLNHIFLISTHTANSSNWWEQYCQTMHIRSFHVIDTYFTPRYAAMFLTDLQKLDYDKIFNEKQSNLKYLFSYYGGSYGAQERDYLALQMCHFYDSAMIDYVGTFKSQRQFTDYVEQISYFLDDKCVNELDGFYKKYVNQDQKLIVHPHWKQYTEKFQLNEPLNLSGLQWQVDRDCFATVIRETWQNDCFYQASEKTWRTFYHCNIAIPLGYDSVRELERRGFWFPHDLIDYSYSSEPVFHDRTERLKKSLHNLNKIPIKELANYLRDNWNKIVDNSIKINKLSERVE